MHMGRVCGQYGYGVYRQDCLCAYELSSGSIISNNFLESGAMFGGSSVNPLPVIFSASCSCDETLSRITQSLTQTGLRVMETFDLHNARLGAAATPCPYHGATQCDCQMVVLMIYGKGTTPTALTLHGNGGQTWLSLTNNPAQKADVLIYAAIEKALKEIPPGQGL
jgi:hypothetical protein